MTDAAAPIESGAHDMGGVGGMKGYGAIFAQDYAPNFSARWESRVFAMTLAVAAWRKWNLDETRFTRERLPAAEYLSMSYYQIWLAGLVTQMLDNGLITEAELMSGNPEPGPRLTPPLLAPRVRYALERGSSTRRVDEGKPAFELGQFVRAVNRDVPGHTRLPKYVRGRVGIIEKIHGSHVFPDSNAHGGGENPQTLYGVWFEARELWWGEAADKRHSVRVDLFEDYLTPA